MPKVSIVIPAYNEERFLPTLLEKILAVDLGSIGFEREIIVVDNGSYDKTSEIASRFPEVRCLRIEVNRGKGEGVKYGIAHAIGDYILIQDADLEYDPGDYLKLLRPLHHAKRPIAVYGSRIKGEMGKHGTAIFPGKHRDKSVATYLANLLLSCWTLILFGRFLTDTLTGYKVYPTNILRRFTIRTNGFETDHELTAKLVRSGVRIIEVPISYNPRTVEQGKKIRYSDFFIALWTFLRFRFSSKKSF